MMNEIECEVCGGNSFYKESGHYFCNDCQTQTQDLQELVFEDEVKAGNNKSVRKINKPQSEKQERKLTSWEYYNTILASLTQELIGLGANEQLKPVVKCLWMKYLKKLEVFNLDDNTAPPKLQLINSKRDGEILCGVKRKRRRSRSSSSTATTTISVTSSNRRESSKRKRALAQSQYKELSQSIQGDLMLKAETLSSLKSPSEVSEAQKCVEFNKYSNEYLSRIMSPDHITVHKKDIERKLPCHKFTYRHIKGGFLTDASNLSRVKLYCILYLGLLITKDKIQLGDLLRFIREGHLDFTEFHHLFPESKLSDLPSLTGRPLYSGLKMRQSTAKLAKLLKVVKHIKVPNIVELSKRYCKELNLPGEVHSCVENLISQSCPQLKFSKNHNILPNYEGRTMSLILIVLKLLFGLDGKTEFEFSYYAQKINSLNISDEKMFDILNWLEYIGYRDLVVSKYHFPTGFVKNPDKIDSDMFLEYSTKRIKIEEEKQIPKILKKYKEVLTQAQQLQEDIKPSINFPVTLTPFFDYSQTILDSKKLVHRSSVLERNFLTDSLDFLLRPDKYLSVVGASEVKRGGANKNISLKSIRYRDSDRIVATRMNKQKITVKVTSESYENNFQEFKNRHIEEMTNAYHKHETFCKDEIECQMISDSVKFSNINKSERTEERHKTHYNPFERHWLMIEQFLISKFTKEDCKSLMQKFPHTLNMILKECSRVIEQTEQELIYEFQTTELYLAFSAKLGGRNINSVHSTNRKLRHLINKSAKEW